MHQQATQSVACACSAWHSQSCTVARASQGQVKCTWRRHACYGRESDKGRNAVGREPWEQRPRTAQTSRAARVENLDVKRQTRKQTQGTVCMRGATEQQGGSVAPVRKQQCVCTSSICLISHPFLPPPPLPPAAAAAAPAAAAARCRCHHLSHQAPNHPPNRPPNPLDRCRCRSSRGP